MLTPEQIEEYLKCNNDPKYFIEKYIKLNLTPTQLTLLEKYQTRGIQYVNSTRQSGLTTGLLALGIYDINFNYDKSIVYLARSKSEMIVLRDNFLAMYDNIHPTFKLDIIQQTENTIYFSNGCYVKFTHEINGLRGTTYYRIYIDNFEYLDSDIKTYINQNLLPIYERSYHGNILITTTF